MAENVPSPTSTGGAGTTYEQRVGAVFLTYLLTGARPMIFKRSRVAKVSFQTRLHGWKTDDLLVECLTDEGESHKMAVQVKFGTNTRPGSDGFAKTVRGFWEDFHADRFSPVRDALVVAAVPGNPHLVPLGKLAECARNSSDAKDFARRLDARGSVSSKVKECKRTIHSIVGENGSPGVTDEELWPFLKAIHVCYFDLSTSTNQSEGDAKRLLENLATGSDPAGDADATWNELVGLAADSAHGGKAVDRDSLPDAMLKRHETARVSVLDELSDHSSVVLESINSAIAGTVTLPREEKMAEISDAIEKDRAVMLTGGPGYGKSALAKETVRRREESHTCMSFRAEEFAKSHIEEALPGSLSVRQFEALLGPHPVLIHIESLERLLEHPTRDAFSDLVTIAGRHPNVRLLLTCRDQAAQPAISAFFERSKVECGKVKVPPLDAEEMQQVKDKLPHLGIPLSQKGLDRLMRIPYYLDKTAEMSWSNRDEIPLDIKAFRGKCWRDVIRKDSYTAMGLDDRREQAIVDLSVRRARELRPFVPAKEYDQEALDGLHKDGIVIRDENGLVAPAHDIIEDWAVMKWIEMLATEHEWQAGRMAKGVEPHPAVRRVFVKWLKEGLDASDERAHAFVSSAYSDDSLPRYFRDDVLISVLRSNSANSFVLRQKSSLLADNALLLIEIMRLTRVACKIPSGPHGDESRQVGLLVPDGKAWPALLGIVSDNMDSLLPRNAVRILGLLEDWSLGANPDGPAPDGTPSAGAILDKLLDSDESFSRDLRKQALVVLARVPQCNEKLFLDLIDRRDSTEESSGLSDDLANLLIVKNYGMRACIEFPEQMRRFVLSRCLLSEADFDRLTGPYAASMCAEYEFGLNPDLRFDLPPSACKGPFLFLLLSSSGIGLQLVLDLVNRAGCWYRRWSNKDVYGKPPHSVSISVPGHGNADQWADEPLWLAYRGLGHVPVIIQCALMALESWLLSLCEKSYDVAPILLEVLRESNNVMITAVVASVCGAHPELCATVAFPILESRKCVELDIMRKLKESDTKLLTGRLVASSGNASYAGERRRSNMLQHRQRDLRDLALELQRRGKAEQIQRIIDAHITALPDDASKTESDRQWQQTLRCMDLRNADFDNATPVQNGSASEEEPRTFMSVPIKYDEAGMTQMSPDARAAYVLPKVLAAEPDCVMVLEAVSRTIIHTSHEVSVEASAGVAEYLWPGHRSLALRCAGAAAMVANLLSDYEQHHETEPTHMNKRTVKTLLDQTRRAFVKGDIDSEHELRKLDPASRHGRSASELILIMLRNATDLDLTRDLFIRTCRATVNMWTARRSGRNQSEYSDFKDTRTPVMAGVALTLSSGKLRLFCQPLLDAVSTHPDDVAFFVDMLVHHQSMPASGSSFWDAWQVFADRILESSWPCIDRRYLVGMKLVESMLFREALSEGIQINLSGHEEQVNAFVSRLPVTPPLLASYSLYLSTVGGSSLPSAFTVVAGMLQNGNPAKLLTENAVARIESILQRYVYGQPKLLKASPKLRRSVLLILDSLIDVGSPMAYKMQNDFVAPSASSS